jgi:hypothetical protein
VQVKVLDINDNAPSFSQAVYSATILEAAELGAPVTQVNPFKSQFFCFQFFPDFCKGTVARDISDNSVGLI